MSRVCVCVGVCVAVDTRQETELKVKQMPRELLFHYLQACSRFPPSNRGSRMLGGTGAAGETEKTFSFACSDVKLFTASSRETSSFFRHAGDNAGERESEQ